MFDPIASALTVNFQTVGGLMIYSLISNPAAAAFQLARGCHRAPWWSAGFGAASGLGGFLIAAVTDLPSGTVIVLVSSVLLLAAAAARRLSVATRGQPRPQRRTWHALGR